MPKADIDIRLERTPDGCSRRYYELTLQRDLFGAAILHRRWGGVGRARGGARLEGYYSLAAARRAAARWLRLKRRRGYRKAQSDGPAT